MCPMKKDECTFQEDSDIASNPEDEVESIISQIVNNTPTLDGQDVNLFEEWAILYRYNAESVPQWVEHGNGFFRLLLSKVNQKVRIFMRRDITPLPLSLCTNHFILPSMQLKSLFGSETTYIWSTQEDFTAQVPRKETFGVKFMEIEAAKTFVTLFNAAKLMNNSQVTNAQGDTAGSSGAHGDSNTTEVVAEPIPEDIELALSDLLGLTNGVQVSEEMN